MSRHVERNARRKSSSPRAGTHPGRRGNRDAEPHGRELLYGRQPVREMMRAGRRRVETLYLQQGIRNSSEIDEIEQLAKDKGIRVQSVDSLRMAAMAGDGHHQGVAAEVSPFRYVSHKKMLSDAEQNPAPLFLILDHLEDPQNVGSLLRSAEAAGVTGVILPEYRAAGITAAVVRASAGAAEHIPVAQVPNLVRCMKLLKDRGVWFAGLEGSSEATDLASTDLIGPLGLVVGSEGRGMRRLTRENCDYLVKLPMFGKVGSLNAAVAGAIALFEVIRQRANTPSTGTGKSQE